MSTPPTSRDFRRRMKGYKAGSGTFRMNVALRELPDFTCLPEPASTTSGHHHRPDARLHGPRLHSTRSCTAGPSDRSSRC
jgi:phytoene dehydrogenase-like protein